MAKKIGEMMPLNKKAKGKAIIQKLVNQKYGHKLPNLGGSSKTYSCRRRCHPLGFKFTCIVVSSVNILHYIVFYHAGDLVGEYKGNATRCLRPISFPLRTEESVSNYAHSRLPNWVNFILRAFHGLPIVEQDRLTGYLDTQGDINIL